MAMTPLLGLRALFQSELKLSSTFFQLLAGAFAFRFLFEKKGL